MTDRITSNMVTANVLHGVDEAFAALDRSSEELSTGRSILKPSDEPFGAGRAIGLQSALEGLSAYQGNVAEAISWQDTASGALTSIGNVIQRARELVLQAGNGVDSAQLLGDLGEQAEQLIEAVKQDANVRYGGQYILAGTATTAPPYSAGAEDAYQGNEGPIYRAIGPGLSVTLGAPAVQLLGNGSGAEDGKLLDVLRTIAADLHEGTPEAVESLRTTGLQGLEANMRTLVSMQVRIGSTTTRLRGAESSLEALHVTTAELLSNVQDANMAQVSIAYSGQQAAYEAALRAGGSIIQLSLLEFLK